LTDKSRYFYKMFLKCFYAPRALPSAERLVPARMMVSLSSEHKKMKIDFITSAS
jgi:hypothetical protein